MIVLSATFSTVETMLFNFSKLVKNKINILNRNTTDLMMQGNYDYLVE